MYKENIKTKIFNPGSGIWKPFFHVDFHSHRTTKNLTTRTLCGAYINAAKLLFFITGFNAL